MFQLNEKIRGQYKQTCLSEYTLPENVSSVRIDYENGELKVFINSQPVHFSKTKKCFFLDIDKAVL